MMPPSTEAGGKELTQRTEASLHGPCFLHQWEGTLLFSEKGKQTLSDYFHHRGQFPQVLSIHASQSPWTLWQTMRWEEPETLGTGAVLRAQKCSPRSHSSYGSQIPRAALLRAPTLLGTLSYVRNPSRAAPTGISVALPGNHSAGSGTSHSKEFPGQQVRASRAELALACQLPASGWVRSVGAGGDTHPGFLHRRFRRKSVKVSILFHGGCSTDGSAGKGCAEAKAGASPEYQRSPVESEAPVIMLHPSQGHLLSISQI